MAAYTASCRTVKVDSWAAVMSNRSAATIPATDNEVRWKTARV